MFSFRIRKTTFLVFLSFTATAQFVKANYHQLGSIESKILASSTHLDVCVVYTYIIKPTIITTCVSTNTVVVLSECDTVWTITEAGCTTTTITITELLTNGQTATAL
jgi:hypothetical protein